MSILSVICPVHDTDPEFLRVAARSVLDEPSEFVGELILVDDASRRAETLAAEDALAREDPRVRLVRLARGRGPAGARNAGVAEARFEWIGFVDSDDAWPPGRKAVFDMVLAQAPDAGWIAGPWAKLGEPVPTEEIAPHLAERAVRRRLPGLVVAEGRDLAVAFLDGMFFLHLGGMMMKRRLFDQAGGLDEKILIGEDVFLALGLASLTPLHYVTRPTYFVRMGHASLTSSRRALRIGDTAMLAKARRDPRFRAIRRELRWSYYRAAKRLAASNLLNGFPIAAFGWALRAWLTDPRETRDLFTFLRLALDPGSRRSEAALRVYSLAHPLRLRGHG